MLVRNHNCQFIVKELSCENPRPVVYMEESYIHHHYASHQDSMFDRNDVQDLQVKAHHKGLRYCFIAGILDDGEESSRLLALDVFQGGKKAGRERKDYHGMFTTKYFVEWFGGLLDELDYLGRFNALTVMDNAKYHKSIPSDTPKYGWKKENLKASSRMHEDLDTHCSQRCAYFRFYGENRGHDVVFTPPHHSDLQPIELVWAAVKDEIGRQYTTITSFDDVLRRLYTAFDGLTLKTIHGCINESKRRLFALNEHLERIESRFQNDTSEASQNGVNSDENVCVVPSDEARPSDASDSSGACENDTVNEIWYF
ncbi:hypothetical protein LEN26_018316 [Aphanomyces euteiches]|nr:hypothetical protein LEN26_018316 [Aphanomyces euteiches]